MKFLVICAVLFFQSIFCAEQNVVERPTKPLLVMDSYISYGSELFPFLKPLPYQTVIAGIECPFMQSLFSPRPQAFPSQLIYPLINGYALTWTMTGQTRGSMQLIRDGQGYQPVHPDPQEIKQVLSKDLTTCGDTVNYKSTINFPIGGNTILRFSFLETLGANPDGTPSLIFVAPNLVAKNREVSFELFPENSYKFYQCKSTVYVLHRKSEYFYTLYAFHEAMPLLSIY